jgi:hypothetical protein
MNKKSAPQKSKLGVWLFAIFGSLAGVGALVGGTFWLFSSALAGHKYKAHKEAKLTLSTLFTAQMLIKAEHDFYASDLQHGDLTPSSTRYSYGYVQASPPNEQTQAIGIDPQRHFHLSELSKSRDEADPETLLARMRELCPDCVVTESGFKAFAFANLDGDADWDVWTIDQDKKLQHVQNDLEDL